MGREERDAMLSNAVGDAALGEAVIAALHGEPVSDFMESFGPVREAQDLVLKVKGLEQEREQALDLLMSCPGAPVPGPGSEVGLVAWARFVLSQVVLSHGIPKD